MQKWIFTQFPFMTDVFEPLTLLFLRNSWRHLWCGKAQMFQHPSFLYCIEFNVETVAAPRVVFLNSSQGNFWGMAAEKIQDVKVFILHPPFVAEVCFDSLCVPKNYHHIHIAEKCLTCNKFYSVFHPFTFAWQYIWQIGGSLTADPWWC